MLSSAQYRLVPVKRLPEVERPHPFVPSLVAIAFLRQERSACKCPKEDEVTRARVAPVLVGKRLAVAVVANGRRVR